MCARYTQQQQAEAIARRFRISRLLSLIVPSYNIAPTHPVATIYEENGNRCLENFQWGLIPMWVKDLNQATPLINARCETLKEKASFKHALKYRRCLIPADGYFEWMKAGKQKFPVYFRLKGGEPFAFAGLWDEWHSPDGSTLRSTVIVTTTANALVHKVHDRMPVIMRRDAEDKWLKSTGEVSSEILDLLQPFPVDQMEEYPVTPKMNSPQYNMPECVAPYSAQESKPQQEFGF